MKTEMSIEEFIQAVKRLPSHEHKKEWIRWLSDYDKPGPFNRQAGEKRSAKFAYNNLAYPEMLLWLGEAVGIDIGLIEMVKADNKQIQNVRSQCAAIRRRIPWEDVEPLIRN